jgi:SAM-dependent methyltransferase
LKSNVHTAKKNTFFQKANYFEPAKYDEHFNPEENKVVRRENEEIRAALDCNMIFEKMRITDIGCGSGLGRKLVPPDTRYTGVDSSKNSIDYCKQNYEGTFICKDAADYIKGIDALNPIFLFSLDYLSLETIEEYLQKTDALFFAVHCNQPYLHPYSVYANKKDVYYELHPREEIQKRIDLLDLYGVITTPLLDEPYYYLSILQK